jgi:hypothetical protein
MPDPVPNLNSPFYRALNEALCRTRSNHSTQFVLLTIRLARRVLHDYGAMFVGSRDILPPPVCVFTSEDEVTKFLGKAAGGRRKDPADESSSLQPAGDD